MKDKLLRAAKFIVDSRHFSVLTGAGISVESGVPPFRGKNGLWSRYDPALFDISYFISSPEESWKLIKKLFFESFEKAQPNQAHFVLSRLEEKGLLKSLITQNIDGLHHRAGNRNVIEYHGSTRELVCMKCKERQEATNKIIEKIPPMCRCGGVLKPNIVFFGEEIPLDALLKVQEASEQTDVLLVIGTTGEVFPASSIPIEVKKRGARIIEVNTAPSSYTNTLIDIYLQGQATVILKKLEDEINNLLKNET